MNLDNFFNLVNKNTKYDPFFEEQTSLDYFSGLKDEINESLEEYEKGDNSELEKELGDVVWDYFCLLEKLELEGKISKQNVIDSIVDKISRRKSFLLEDKKLSKEEARIVWNEAKLKEGYDKSRLWND